MNRCLSTIIAAMLALAAAAQQLPQFDSYSFDGWTYNNPGIELSTANIGSGRVALYVNSLGMALTLTSPQFDCQGLDSIAASVLWYTGTFQDEDFDLSRASLTLAIDDTQGQPVDSVTCTPATTGSSRTLKLQLAVPRGMDACRLRFVSWTGDVISSGAIKRAAITAVAASPHEDILLGDVDRDGRISIADVTILIDTILMGDDGEIDIEAADVDRDGYLTIGDVTVLIDIILDRG